MKTKKETFRQMRSELVFDRFVETPLLKVIATFLKETPVVSILLVILEKVNVCKHCLHISLYENKPNHTHLEENSLKMGKKNARFQLQIGLNVHSWS